MDFAMLCWIFLIFPQAASAQSTLVDPLDSDDAISSYRLDNRQQCERLCWYVAACVRHSYSSRGGEEDNCVLHGRLVDGAQVLEPGWGQDLAVASELAEDHGCRSVSQCGTSDVCIPVAACPDHTNFCSSLPGFNHCAHLPCENGGTCAALGNNYTCNCVLGYTGFNCQTDVDECASQPCQNGGQCNDLVNGFNCTCIAGYTGTHCETDTDECASSPCQHGGTCVNLLNAFSCTCPPTFSGVRCQTGINWLGSACVGGPECVAENGVCFAGYCQCAGGYYFSHSLYTCVKPCPSYHLTEYVVYDEFKLKGHDLNYVLTAPSVEHCLDLCTRNVACIMVLIFDKGSDPFHCYLKSATPREEPSDWEKPSCACKCKSYEKTCA